MEVLLGCIMCFFDLLLMNLCFMWTTVSLGGMEWCIVYTWWEIVVYSRNRVYRDELVWSPSMISPQIVDGLQADSKLSRYVNRRTQTYVGS